MRKEREPLQAPWRAAQTPALAVVPPAEQVTRGWPKLEKLYPFAHVAKRNSSTDFQIDAGHISPISFHGLDIQYPSIAVYKENLPKTAIGYIGYQKGNTASSHHKISS